MDLGELNDHAHEICFLLLQNIFSRELRENPNRTRSDMLLITEKILSDMNLEANNIIIERIVDGTLWFRDPSRQEAFGTKIFNESTGAKEDYFFRYLRVDRENSLWDQGGSTVYMLTDESQEMIFITREILEEFGFNLEQFYTMQLIKTGNFTKARNSIDHLVARVRVLINREKEYRQDIIRDPQNIFIDRSFRGKKTEDEIKEQFEEEQKVFQNMLSWKERYTALPDEKKREAETMFENLERARSLHNTLAKYVMENLALEMEIRVKYPESFWSLSNYSFKKDIWKNHIVKNGLSKISDLEKLISTLFSPVTEFIFPLEWAWNEQVVQSKKNIKKLEDDIQDEGWNFREIDWDILTLLYEEVFQSLLEKGRYSILELNNKDETGRKMWLSQRENIDLFMMFVISRVTLDFKYKGNDERLKLYKLLCDKDPAFKVLQGKRIAASIEDTSETFKWHELYISPYVIYLED